MNSDISGIEKNHLPSDFGTFTFPIITSKDKFSRLMKDFSEAFDRIEFESSNPSFFNTQFLKEFFTELNTVRDKISNLKSLIENHTTSVASLFLNIQKNQIYDPILKNFIELKRNCCSIIEQEIQKRETIIRIIKCDYDNFTEELKMLKDETNLLQSDTILSMNDELMKINESSIESAHQCISYQNEIAKLDNDISNLYPLINQKTEEMKSFVVDQSSLRSKLATLGSQISTITTDCAAFTIDIENNTKKLNQGQINLHQKELELSTIENEIKSQFEKINEMETKLNEKEEEIKRCKENMNDIQSKIDEYKLNIEKIESSISNDITIYSENKEAIIVPSIIKLHKMIELKEYNERLLSEKELLDQRNCQLEKIIDKKTQMINDDKRKIEKKQLRYEELQEIFQLRKIMLITAFDDINHKNDKIYNKIHELEMQVRKKSNSLPIASESSDNYYDVDFESNEKNKSNWNTFNSNTKILSKANSSYNTQSFAQTPQVVRKFSKLFPNTSNSKNMNSHSNYHIFSPSSQK